MRIISDDDIIKENTVCALGLFDGVHSGHSSIIRKAVEKAEAINGKAAVFSFKTNSITSKGHDGRLEMLLSDTDKQEKMSEIGVEYIYSPDFEKLKKMPPEQFVAKILKDKLNCRCAVCGTDFTFGLGALGKADDLVKLGRKYGIEVIIMPPLTYKDEIISSTEIRRCIRHGKIEKANEMLGYKFFFNLEVVKGFARGRTWNFPTINQQIPRGRVIPKFGVYCSVVTIDGVKYKGVTNIGIKPTVKENVIHPLAETFIIDFDGDLYGKVIKTELWEFLRPEKCFDSFDELKSEIGKNILQTKEYFKEVIL